MVCPQLEEIAIPVASFPAAQLPAPDGSLVFAVLNAFAASPDRIEM